MRQKATSRARKPERPADAAYPESIAALLERGDVGAAQELQQIATGPDRAMAKAARRALFVLRAAGVEPPPLPAAPSVAAQRTVAQQAYMSAANPQGDLLVGFVAESEFGGSPWIGIAEVNLVSGLHKVTAAKLIRRRVAEILDRMRAQEDAPFPDAPPDYARHLVHEAAERMLQAGNPLPEGYTQMAAFVGSPDSAYLRPLIYEMIDADALQSDYSFSRDARRFFEKPVYRTWILRGPAVEEWAGKLLESSKTHLVLAEHQKAAVVERILDEATDALVGPESIALHRRQLEETALTMRLAGHEEAAKQGLYHALTVVAGRPPHSIAWLRELVRRSMVPYLPVDEETEEDQVQEARDSLIYRI
jgi:hypothetical protein